MSVGDLDDSGPEFDEFESGQAFVQLAVADDASGLLAQYPKPSILAQTPCVSRLKYPTNWGLVYENCFALEAAASLLAPKCVQLIIIVALEQMFFFFFFYLYIYM